MKRQERPGRPSGIQSDVKMALVEAQNPACPLSCKADLGEGFVVLG